MMFTARPCSRTLVNIMAVFILSLIAGSVLNACSLPFSGNSTPKSTPTSQGILTQTGGSRRSFKFAIVTDGQASDPFWSVVKRGADQAAADMGVTVTYSAPPTYSATAMSQLIDATVATQPDGLVVSIPDCAGLSPSIKRAQLVNIPVISINSGSDCATQLGLLNHIGQTAYSAGLASGQKLVAAGAKHVLCINQEVGNAELDARCQGVSDALRKARGKAEVFAADLTNPSVTQENIQTRLTRDGSINGLITLSPDSATIAIAALQQLGRLGQVKLATFDISSTVLAAIQQSNILFAVDQQQYLQGYLPIVLLTLYKTNMNTVMTPVITTGPNFITQQNVAQVQQLLATGTR